MTESGPPCVLVAESNAIVALDLCETLQEAGYRVAGPLATVAATEALLEREHVDLAVIEPKLKDGDCSRTLRHLRRRGVPFILHTACHRADPITRGFGDAPWLAKPAIPWDVVIALDEIAIGSL
jgi:DNA-binding response OmpR family regulator